MKRVGAALNVVQFQTRPVERDTCRSTNIVKGLGSSESPLRTRVVRGVEGDIQQVHRSTKDCDHPSQLRAKVVNEDVKDKSMSLNVA